MMSNTCLTCVYFGLEEICYFPQEELSGAFPHTSQYNYCKKYKEITQQQRIERLEKTIERLNRIRRI